MEIESKNNAYDIRRGMGEERGSFVSLSLAKWFELTINRTDNM
jgi:hypothetical protein